MTHARPTVIGVDLGGTNVRAGRMGRSLEAHAAMGLRDTGNSESVVEDICASIERVMSPGVWAIGIGVPTLVDPVEGIIHSATNIPSWRELPIKRRIEERFHLPAYVNNDANCFALGEFHYGLGKGSQCLVGLTIGTGLGAGLITRGQLFTGAHGGAGEIGSLPFQGHTLEYHLSGRRFPRLHGTEGQALLDRAGAGDQTAMDAFADFGGDLACAVKAILYTYDPDTIILGGSVSKAYPFFQAAMHRSLADFAFPHVLPGLRILPSQDDRIPVLGAAALCLDAGGAPGSLPVQAGHALDSPRSLHG